MVLQIRICDTVALTSGASLFGVANFVLLVFLQSQCCSHQSDLLIEKNLSGHSLLMALVTSLKCKLGISTLFQLYSGTGTISCGI